MDHRAAVLPGLGYPLDIRGGIFRQGGQHHFLAHIQVGERGIRPILLASRDRMAGHETGDLAAQRSARRCNHVGLGAAGIGNHGAGAEMGLDGRQNRAGLRHGRCDQHQVGAIDRFGR